MDAPREDDLLASAFGVPIGALRPISREPFGAGSVAGFEVEHRDSAGAPATTIAYVDTSGTAVPRETGLVLESVARVWTHPADPHLPALVPTAFGGALSILLARLGIEATGAPALVAYRPGRRAVLSVPAGERTAWVKVVRPRRIERIVEAHRAMESAGLPIPRVRGWSPEGVLVIDEAEGAPATDADVDPEELVAEIDDLRSRIGRAEVSWEARAGMPARLDWYVRTARAAMPGEEGRIARLAGACERALADGPGATGTIHGDLHLGQLFVTSRGAVSRITGIIDVDTAGRGDPAEDAAAFVSHAAASAVLTPPGPARERMGELARAAARRWRGARADALTAVQLLGHAVAAATAGERARAATLLGVAEAAVAGEPLCVGE